MGEGWSNGWTKKKLGLVEDCVWRSTKEATNQGHVSKWAWSSKPFNVLALSAFRYCLVSNIIYFSASWN